MQEIWTSRLWINIPRSNIISDWPDWLETLNHITAAVCLLCTLLITFLSLTTAASSQGRWLLLKLQLLPDDAVFTAGRQSDARPLRLPVASGLSGLNNTAGTSCRKSSRMGKRGEHAERVGEWKLNFMSERAGRGCTETVSEVCRN